MQIKTKKKLRFIIELIILCLIVWGWFYAPWMRVEHVLPVEYYTKIDIDSFYMDPHSYEFIRDENGIKRLTGDDWFINQFSFTEDGLKIQGHVWQKIILGETIPIQSFAMQLGEKIRIEIDGEIYQAVREDTGIKLDKTHKYILPGKTNIKVIIPTYQDSPEILVKKEVQEVLPLENDGEQLEFVLENVKYVYGRDQDGIKQLSQNCEANAKIIILDNAISLTYWQDVLKLQE